MKKLFSILAGIGMLFFSNGKAQDASNPRKFFPKEKLMQVGVYYYPEHWPQTQWERDFKNMAAMGFEFTHFAEFAWAQLEPEEGKYDFVWLDKAVELAAKNNIKVIMCTPTPTPPAWLTRKYPDVLVVKDDGIKGQHGTREHVSWSSTKFRELTEKLMVEMGKHYGHNKNVWGWQLDNEPSHYGNEDYGPEVEKRFVEWLKKKYGTIEKLNDVWGTAFWSMHFNSFDQVQLPNSKALFSGLASHTDMLDFKRFSADECSDFLCLQNNTLRKYISADQWITSNFMQLHDKVDPWRTKCLDFLAYTTYPVSGHSDGIGELGFRMGDPVRISFMSDFSRPFSGVAGVMELQVSQVNWGPYDPQPLPGVIRAFLWNAFATDLSFACCYRFRQPTYGGELMNSDVLLPDGVTPTRGGQEWADFTVEMKNLRKQYDPKAKNPQSYENRKAAVIINYDNWWDTHIQKLTGQWFYENTVMRYYAGLKAAGAPVDVITEEKDFSQYKVLVAPAYALIDEQLVERWKKYVEDGGNIIFTCRSGLKNRDSHLWEAEWAKPVADMAGIKINFFDMLSETRVGKISFDNKTYEWNNWAEIMDANPGTDVWSTYTDQFYSGKVAVSFKKYKKGSVTYVAVDTDNGKLERDVIRKVYESAGIAALALPEGLILNYRDGFGVAINYNSSNVEAPVPANAKIITGTKQLQPAGVVVWKE
jgi:beta-galactosidase